MKFPININSFRGLPINNHPGSFGYIRKHDVHTGIDIYVDEMEPIYAIEDGTVINYYQFTGKDIGFDWWLDTWALVVKSTNGYFIYGEIKSDKKIGDIVKAGDHIGNVIPVLPKEKIRDWIPGHSNCMLHLERYNLDYKLEYGWVAWEIGQRKPHFLEDPTPFLIKALDNNLNTLTI
jgi:hypothetical protein